MGNQQAKPKDISKKNDLTSIDLEEHIPVEPEKVQATLISLPSEFEKIESLDDLTLYEYLEHHPNINRIDLSNYNTGHSIKGTIPDRFIRLLMNLEHLEYLYLYNNQLCGNIPSELGNIKNLSKLYLYNNQLCGNIPSEIGNITNLKHFNVRNNNLNGEYPTKYSKKYGKCSFDNNNFTINIQEDEEYDDKSIPSWSIPNTKVEVFPKISLEPKKTCKYL